MINPIDDSHFLVAGRTSFITRDLPTWFSRTLTQLNRSRFSNLLKRFFFTRPAQRREGTRVLLGETERQTGRTRGRKAIEKDTYLFVYGKERQRLRYSAKRGTVASLDEETEAIGAVEPRPFSCRSLSSLVLHNVRAYGVTSQRTRDD